MAKEKAKELSKTQAKWELRERFKKAWDILFREYPDAIQLVPVAEIPSKRNRKEGELPKAYIVGAYMEATRLKNLMEEVMNNDGLLEYNAKVYAYNNKWYGDGHILILYKGYEFNYYDSGNGADNKDAVSDTFKRTARWTGINDRFWQMKTAYVKYTPAVENLFRYGNASLKSLGGELKQGELLLDKIPQFEVIDFYDLVATTKDMGALPWQNKTPSDDQNPPAGIIPAEKILTTTYGYTDKQMELINKLKSSHIWTKTDFTRIDEDMAEGKDVIDIMRAVIDKRKKMEKWMNEEANTKGYELNGFLLKFLTELASVDVIRKIPDYITEWVKANKPKPADKPILEISAFIHGKLIDNKHYQAYIAISKGAQ
jgi:hypothetical protein